MASLSFSFFSLCFTPISSRAAALSSTTHTSHRALDLTLKSFLAYLTKYFASAIAFHLISLFCYFEIHLCQLLLLSVQLPPLQWANGWQCSLPSLLFAFCILSWPQHISRSKVTSARLQCNKDFINWPAAVTFPHPNPTVTHWAILSSAPAICLSSFLFASLSLSLSLSLFRPHLSPCPPPSPPSGYCIS